MPVFPLPRFASYCEYRISSRMPVSWYITQSFYSTDMLKYPTVSNVLFFPLFHQPRKTEYTLKSPGSKPGGAGLSRLSIGSQTSLRRSASQTSQIFVPDFFDSLSPGLNNPRASISSTFLPADSEMVTQSLDDSEPDYVNIESIPEKEAPPGLPPRRPPSPKKPRATSLHEERPHKPPVRRMMSMNLKMVVENFEPLSTEPPIVPPQGTSASQQNSDAPPLPPREHVPNSPCTPPPIPPRAAACYEPMGLPDASVANHSDAVPPALPPRTRRS